MSRADGESGRITVFDLSGAVVADIDDARDGMTIPLAPGLYIVSTAGGRPVRLIVR